MKDYDSQEININKTGEIWSYEGFRILHVAFGDTQGIRPTTLQILDSEGPLIIFGLSGKIYLNILLGGDRREHCICSESYGLHLNPGAGCCIRCRNSDSAGALCVYYPWQILQRFLRASNATIDLKRAMENRTPFNSIQVPSTLMKLSVNQIMNSSMHGIARDLFFISKAMELLACFLNSRISVNKYTAGHTNHIIMHEVMTILESSLEDPPTLQEIAGRMGISSSSLKHLFPVVCGMPPYEFLRKKRMEKALDLLRSGTVNVTEAAFEVGYSSLSHFTKTFTNYFGMKPSEVKDTPSIPRI